MNRADLSWALNAVLPHVGNEKNGLNQVGLDFRDGATFVYATDKYTAAIARVNDGMDFRGALPTKEATDLMRFVRPQRVPERDAYVFMEQHGEHGEELHVGFDDFAGSAFESEVYETCEPKMRLDFLLDWIRAIDRSAVEYEELIVNPKLMEKFAKAQRADSDRLWIRPRKNAEAYGAAVVAVGTDFIGAIAGMTYDQQSTARVASFLYPWIDQAA
jgi:hypothetical protein